ncbi:MAG: NADPH-dependent FMN reductase, partial [Microthrixaceae bacterium]
MDESSTDVVVVVGNPQPASRTAAAALAVGTRVAELTGGTVDLIELAEHGPALLSWGDPTVEELRAAVGAARALVVSSPTYKASYTGLTKLFLDRFDAGELGGTPTVAMMTGGSPAHALTVAVHL